MSPFSRPLKRDLKTRAERFKGLAEKTFRHPTPDRVHDLRVLTRRVRADLWLIPKPQRTSSIRRAIREFKELARVLGRQRKYDVALEDAAHYQQDTRRIEYRLRFARRAVKQALKSKRRKRYAAHLDRAVQSTGRIAPSSFAPRIDALREEFHLAKQHPPKTNPARHRLRIQLKKARYLLEAHHHELPELNLLQDHLGRWHDLTVLAKLVGQPKKVVEARDQEWRKARRALPQTLSRTERALKELAHELLQPSSATAPSRSHSSP